jgi:hypothetical protein
MKQKSFCREPAREVLLQEQTVMTALQMVEESGMSAEAREHAAAALHALSGKELQPLTGGQKHVMLSCKRARVSTLWEPHSLRWSNSDSQRREPIETDRLLAFVRCRADQWDKQATIKRVNESLIARGYLTWFDLTNMQGCEHTCIMLLYCCFCYYSRRSFLLCSHVGVHYLHCAPSILRSTMDAMSDAIEGADVMLYGVSLGYKESANVSCMCSASFRALDSVTK